MLKEWKIILKLLKDSGIVMVTGCSFAPNFSIYSTLEIGCVKKCDTGK